MEDLLIPIFALLCIFVLLPGMVLWFMDRQRRHRATELPAPPGLATADLARVAARMEQRLDALERLLDVEAPGWRKRDAD